MSQYRRSKPTSSSSSSDEDVASRSAKNNFRDKSLKPTNSSNDAHRRRRSKPTISSDEDVAHEYTFSDGSLSPIPTKKRNTSSEINKNKRSGNAGARKQSLPRDSDMAEKTIPDMAVHSTNKYDDIDQSRALIDTCHGLSCLEPKQVPESTPYSKKKYENIDQSWALSKTPTSIESDLDTLQGYNSLLYLEPKQVKNAAYLLAMIYASNADDIVKYYFEENEKDFLTPEKALNPEICRLEICEYYRNIKIYVAIISMYSGIQTMNKLKEIMTGAIRGDANKDQEWYDFFTEMGGDIRQLTNTEIKIKNARITCNRVPNDHVLEYGFNVTSNWRSKSNTPCRFPGCKGHRIIQRFSGVYWKTIA
jgi:hypothetical protein